MNTSHLWQRKGLILFLLMLSLWVVYGCGPTEEDDWDTNSKVIRVSNLKGKVIAPASGGSSERISTRGAYFSLPSVKNTRVFLETDSSKWAYADENGDFVILGVPEGKHRLIANIVAGATTYRQRSDLINVTGQYETQSVPKAIELEPALHYLTLHVSDLKTDSPVNAKVKIWGFDFDVINGVAKIGPFPGSIISKEAVISCIGYRDYRCLLTFGDDNNSEIFICLTPTTSTNSNLAPIVEIKQTNPVVKTNERIGLDGTGFDPEGDILTWRWSAEAGEFSNKNAAQTLYTTPSTPGKVRISLVGTDSKGAFGKAVLDLNVEQGTSPGFDPQNNPPVAPDNPYPANMAADMGDTIVLSWNCSDPDNDEINYTVNFGEGSLKVIASNLKEKSVKVSDLKANTKYCWQVTAYDEHYAVAYSDVWEFSTGDLNNQPPNIPTYPAPAHLAKNLEDPIHFSWSGGDPDGDSVVYKVMLATVSTLLETSPTQLIQIARTNLLKYDYYGVERGATYKWQIIAEDSHGAITEGPVWLFSTIEPENHAPTYASITEPADGATGVSVNTWLRWTATDEDGDTLFYKVYFGKDSDPELAIDSLNSQVYKPTGLEYNTKYYWRVEVSDGKKSNPRSDLWSFTTENVPLVMPEIVALTKPASINDYLIINFNKSMDKGKIAKAVSFVPDIEGTWIWENDDKTAKFKPDYGSWWPGSYNRIEIAANGLTDTEGNGIASSLSEAFVLPSAVPVPAGYRSYAFPMKVKANESVSISIPELELGENSYLLAIADADNTNATVSSIRASMETGNDGAFYNSADPTWILRKQEAEMITKPVKSYANSSLRAAVNAAAVGDTKEFYLNNIATETAYPNNRLATTLLASSRNTLVYVDNSITDPGKEEFARKVLTTFDDKILQKVRDAFGNEPEGGVDGESRISIVLFGLPAGNTLAGFFSSVDLYPRVPSDPYCKISNESKVFYIKYDMKDSTTFGTLAHEFQHMINYFQKNQTLKYTAQIIQEETWLNEALAKYSEQVCGYSLLDGDINTASLVDLSMRNNKDLSLTYWGDDTINCYGQVYLFLRFLAQEGRYNSDSNVITRALVNGDNGNKQGEKNVENVTGEPFKETMAKWALSCFLNNYSSTSPYAYGIYGIDLKGTYNGVKLSGYEIEEINGTVNLSGMKRNSMRCFRKVSNGSDYTTIRITTGNKPITLWLFDERK